MARGTDQRIELELAVFSLTQPEAAPATVVQAAAPAAQPFAAAPTPFVATAAAPGPVTIPPVQDAGAPAAGRGRAAGF